ncbi:MAG: cupin domain-containing protein [Bacteroidota bacterium]
MEIKEIEKSEAHIMVEIIDYMPNSVISKTVLKKTTGNVIVNSLDAGEGFSEKIFPFDTFIQIIEGNAEVIIDGKSKMLKTGDGIIVPAHRSNSIKANERFKMIATVIKSGYE